ncbi:pyridoxamine 5'-phosphate oxidase family protein [Kordia sp. YSTF-M3]|uniref:Pyridoxamine 5'-phosphate oxidase family protein n=1 Tax=Kordia aestuariivivens TaxID=2759037 RepID=A0ABR7Q8B4_9FLAO|nr:pyridoxamine 5'-phosphate oxidase family protein [Kordia aestuariivivens]MBC8754802.1 pyridoxamine 5'-phosphate oxidase family protein [Kordia aestuariivivens]
MNIDNDWKIIRKHVNDSFKTSLHVSIATVDSENNPTVTPIGSLFLNRDQSGFYFEKFTSKLPLNATENNNVCVLAVNSSKWLWLKSLWKGTFKKHLALQLYGTLGERRIATEIELSRLSKRMKLTKKLKGNTYLWSDMKYVREIKFHNVAKMKLGKMTAAL